MELNIDAGALVAHLTPDQRLHLHALDTAYVELLSGDVVDGTDIEALAAAVIAFYDGLAEMDVGQENGA